jgi:ribulose-5-phosphate 4-epimerase/fuculose-1-phosphate aldolase
MINRKKKYGRFFFLRVVWKYMWFQNWLFSIFSIIKINSFRSTYINDNFYHFNQPQTIVHTHSIGCLLYSCLDLILKRSTIYLIRLKYTLQIDTMWKNIFEKNLVKCRAEMRCTCIHIFLIDHHWYYNISHCFPS